MSFLCMFIQDGQVRPDPAGLQLKGEEEVAGVISTGAAAADAAASSHRRQSSTSRFLWVFFPSPSAVFFITK